MSPSPAYRKLPTSSVHVSMGSSERHFEVTELVENDGNFASLWVRDSPRHTIGGTEFRIFATRAQLRELRDLLNRAQLGDDEYDVEYAAACRAWEAIGVS